MKKFAAVLILVVGFAIGALAQASGLWTGTAINNPIAATVTNATCNAPAVGVTNICYTGTGAQISCNGGAYIPGSSCTPPAAAGVTSWNGQTGAVTYAAPTPPVTSVNGKTGAVTIAATSSTTTTLQ